MSKKDFCKEYGHNTKVLADYPDATVEVCRDCGKDLIYNKAKDGTIDNARYYKEHLRDFAQPVGPTSGIYAKIYGVPKQQEDANKFWEQREQDRMENWERGMKATDNDTWAKKMKNIVKQDR